MKKLVYNIFFPLCIMALLLSSVIGVSLNRSFYTKEYQKYNNPRLIGIDSKDLDTVTDNLLNYMTGKRENLDMQFKVNGTQREIFDQREKLHMIDVRRLFLTVIYSNCFFIGAACLCLVYILKTKEKGTKKLLTKKYTLSLIVSAVFLAFIAITFAFNFEWFWNNFHKVFFTNDLWILDPAVSIMINMFPLNFFLDMCLAIVFWFAAGLLAIFLLLKVDFKKKNLQS